MRAVLVTVLALAAACSGKCPPSEAKRTPKSLIDESDPSFVFIDRDQLVALCAAAVLPQGSYASEYGALALGDGRRVPWLTIFTDEQYAKNLKRSVLLEREWKATALDVIEFYSHAPPSREELKPGTIHWLNVPCSGDFAADVAITGVFFQKDGFHALAIRGKEVREETLPTTTDRDQVFRKAFELTDQVLGGKGAKIADHKLAGSRLPTVDYDSWVKASTPGK